MRLYGSGVECYVLNMKCSPMVSCVEILVPGNDDILGGSVKYRKRRLAGGSKSQGTCS